MRRFFFGFAMAALASFLWACAPKDASLAESCSASPSAASGSPVLGCWYSPQDSTTGQLCIYEDSVLFYDLLEAYPYYIKADSLIVTGPDGDVFIRWRYVRQHDTLLLFQRPAGRAEEYVVLMTLSAN